jgi:putative endonuclease
VAEALTTTPRGRRSSSAPQAQSAAKGRRSSSAPQAQSAAKGARSSSAPQAQSAAKGARGEELAAAYLRSRGWDIVARNVRSRRGEVDLVAGRGDLLAFVEVKAWDSYDAADLEYAIGPAKRRRIRDAARLFLARRPDLADRRARFDVVLLGGDPPRVRHLENAFTE